MTNTSGLRTVSNIHQPTITPYLPTAINSGAAVIIAPGGGHQYLSIDTEGYNPAQWLMEHGVAAFVLKYRLANETGSTYTIDSTEVPDLQRAIRLVRSRAAEWHIDTAKIGVMGFSAGGQLAGLAGMWFDNGLPNAADAIDKQSSRPAFEVLMYPGKSERFEVTKNTPPAFIVCGDNDPRAATLAQLYLKFKEANIPVEMHIYSNTGHGFGYRKNAIDPSAEWPQQMYKWMISMKWVNAAR